ncbi:MAG: BadF/BadG/BcrA/BcrD ATPase family protein [Rhodomicrobium sp.]
MNSDFLLLGVDGGGTSCRARLCTFSGATVGEGLAGAANVRVNLEESCEAILAAAAQCLESSALISEPSTIFACLALAGASDPAIIERLQDYRFPFRAVTFVTDSYAACIGAHRGKDGGVIIVGTGSIGEGIIAGNHYRVGGWGFPVSDEGSGAWLGCELIRRTLQALDGRLQWTPLLLRISRKFASDPHAIVRWMTDARPGDFATLASLAAEYATRDDPIGCELMRTAALHVETLARTLRSHGVKRLALSGGLSTAIAPWLSSEIRSWFVEPAADALSGAIEIARRRHTGSMP